MEITIELLEAKRAGCAEAVEHHKGLLQANAGALQILEELLAIAKADKPKANEKTEKEK